MITAAAGLREALGRVGYSEDRVDDLRRLPSGDPLATAIRLFSLGETVDRADVDALFDTEALATDQLVEIDGTVVVPKLALTGWQGLVLAHDADRPPLSSDHVVGVHRATRTLASLTVRRSVRRALDIGTACGSQALLASAHAGEVVATDVNPRALELAALNARLNGVDNVELREGSLFAPVAGERFDLVVTNPPFVVSPDNELAFRDAGVARDDLSRAVVEGLPRHLADGGFASTLVCWIHESDEHWSSPLRRWLDGRGCDAWLIRYVTDDAVSYALKWADGQAVDRWIDYYRDAGIGTLSTGAVILRRRSAGAAWTAVAEAATGPSASAGAQLERMFAGRDVLESRIDLMHERLAFVPHRLAERLEWKDGRYCPQSLALELDDTVGVEPEIDPRALRTLFELEGGRPLSELPDAAVALPTLRRLVELGFVERVGDRGFEPRTSALSERRSNQLS